MKPFSHFNARTLDEAVSLLQRYGGKAQVIKDEDLGFGEELGDLVAEVGEVGGLS